MPARFPEMDHHIQEEIGQDNRRWSSIGDDVVISGISGRYPEAATIMEFWENLMTHKDMVTEDDLRWPQGIYGLPTRQGKIRELADFDASFFGVSPKQADVMDPQLRMMLEATYESLFDAGYNPAELRGTRTGVFIGSSTSDADDYLTRTPDRVNGYGLTGTAKAMFANRISYTYDFRGPSYVVDTACSSSLVAFHQAYMAIKSGQCDAAIVGGSSINLKPTASLQFFKLSMLSPQGACKAFDAAGNGYVRSEGIIVAFLQKTKDARRIYGTVLNTGNNTDGFKTEGITFPSSMAQKNLVSQVYKEAGIDPAEVSYVEAHGTGTKVGDPQEVNGIVDIFCKGRNSPLLIGSVKSNMGHSEPSSGLCQISKVALAMNEGVIPANLHFKNPNPNIPALSDGRLQVVDKNWKWNGGLAGINSFGFGGANAHVILRSNPKPKPPKMKETIPRIVAISGRTKEGVTKMLEKIEKLPHDEEMLAMLNDIHSHKIIGHSWRGYSILSDSPIREVMEESSEPREVWYIFSGMGSQWCGMGKMFMGIDVFAKSINKSAALLSAEGVDLLNLMNSSDETIFDNVLHSFVFIASVQVALVDLLTSLGISPDGFVGHSAGELGCAYADGGFTAEQTVMAAYLRGRAILESKLARGAMAAVGMEWEQVKKHAPEGIYAACHNGADSVTISGPPDAIDKFVAKLTAEGVFAKKVSSGGFAFHSKYISDSAPKLRAGLEKIIPAPKPRTKRWRSSSIPESGWNSQLAAQCSAAYHVNNLLSPVLFYEALQHIPENAVVIEIAPHALLQAILKRTVPKNCINVGLINKNSSDGLGTLLSNIGRLFNAGLQPKIKELYPPVSYPVSKGTPNLSSIVEWDHSTKWAVPDFSLDGSGSSEAVIEINMAEQDAYIAGHCIDGRVLFPAAGYLTVVWKAFADLHQRDVNEFPVVFENTQFMRATIMPKDGIVKFLINIFSGSGEFELSESSSNDTVVKGRIRKSDGMEKEGVNIGDNIKPDTSRLELNKDNVYRDLRLRGYDYDGVFQGIIKSDNMGNVGELEWCGKWIPFIDFLLQYSMVRMTTRDLYLPVSAQKVILDPLYHQKQLSSNNTVKIVHDHDLGIIKAGGVETRGIKSNIAPRKQQTHSDPKHERYTFVPFKSSKEMSFVDALTSQLQLAIENSGLLVKIVEVLTTSAAPIADRIVDVVSCEGSIRVDVHVASTGEIPKLNDVKVIAKDLKDGPVDTNIDLLVGSKLLSSSQLLENAVEGLKKGGFIMSVESAQFTTGELNKVKDLVIVSETKCDECVFVLLRKAVSEAPKNVIKIRQTDFKWIEDVRDVMKDENEERVILLGDDEPTNGIVGFFNCLKQEENGSKLRCFFTNGVKFSADVHKEVLKKDLRMNILKNGVWGSYRHLPIYSGSQMLAVEHAYVNTITKGDLASLRWIEGPLSFYKKENYPNNEFCTIYYSALNFRDIMLATGKLPPDALPGDLASQDCVLGLEFSGRDSNGNRVMGMFDARGLATTALGDPDFLWPIPAKWSLEQAATIPVVYSTSYYALIIRGNMKKGESVLIHAGTGGVGQAAISIALHMGCNVFTTVGSQEKRDFLKKRFPDLKQSHIGNSRDTSFEQMVMKETKGKGVDLVLNSLSDEKLQASLRCLGKHGRFLEIGKFDLSNNTPLGMSLFLKNTTFHGILLDSLFDQTSNNPDRKTVFNLVNEGIKNGAVQPLPSTVFSQNQIEQSFRFMATGKHIGKVLLKIRDEEITKVCKPKQQLIEAVPRTYFNPEKSYIIVGGLGGFGIELTHWMIRRGAKKLVLVSRSGITNGYQDYCHRRWENEGATVIISKADCTCLRGANELISEANKLGPVGGIFNLAAVLRDGTFLNQTEADFVTVSKPKVDSTKCLDVASRSCSQLDYFVIFSSAACGRGNIGQTNYGMANSCMERIVEERQASGLPGLAIQWGAIGDVGLVIDALKGTNESVIIGTLPQRIKSCMETLDFFLQQPDPILASYVVAEKKKSSEASSVSVVDAIANILGVKDSSSISPTMNLGDLGMDSLMGSEIKQTLERNYDIFLSTQEIRNLTFEKLMAFSGAVQEGGSSEEESKSTPVQEKPHLMPQESLVSLPAAVPANGEKPLFLVHPIEGDIKYLEELASHLPFSTWGFQCTVNAPLESISTLANFYIKNMERVQTSDPVAVCGYSFGALVAFEIGLQLEASGRNVKLFLVDGSPDFVRNQTELFRSKREDANECEAFTYFISLIRNLDSKEFASTLKEFQSLPNLESRQNLIVKKLDSVGYDPEEVKSAAYSFYKKTYASHYYTPSAMFKGKVVLFRAEGNFVTNEQDYGLGKICKQPIVIHSFVTTHKEIIKGDTAKKIAEKITEYVKS